MKLPSRKSAPAPAPAAPDPDLPGYPAGWFVVSRSDALKPGQLMTRMFFGREIVVFRGRDGVATAVDAYCPHMGAHFGHGGTVEGSALRCPFHGFEFDHEGACTKTGYGTTPPADARLETLPLRDINGFLLVWFSPDGASPSWEVPAVPNEGRWSPLMTRTFTLRAHPQETTENSVDLGHLSVVHGYENVASLRPLRTEGPWLNAQYQMHRPVGIAGAREGMRDRKSVV